VDKIILSGIEFYAFGGVSAPEREVGQRYRVNVELLADLSVAARTDSIADTVHYGRVHDIVVATARERPFNLLEYAANRIAHRLLEVFPVIRVTVELQKLLPPIEGVVSYAAVQVTRARDESRTI
jgi:dihydroneopterin aldolase